MGKRIKEWAFPNLEMWMWEFQISASDLADLLHVTRQTVYYKLYGKSAWSSLEKKLIREHFEKITKRKITDDFLFKQEDSNGKK